VRGTQAEGVENRTLRRIFGTKRGEVAGEWKNLHHEELNDLYQTLYYSGDQIEKNKMGGACSTMGRDVYRRRWEDNIKTDIQEVGCGGMD